MTVLAAACNGRRAWMAADSRVSEGNTFTDGIDKMRVRGLAIVGLSGALYAYRAVEAYTGLKPGDDATLWVEGLADAVHAALRDRGHGTSEGGSAVQGVYMLVATPGSVYRVSGDGAVLRMPNGWGAQGSGHPEASGAMLALSDLHPAQRCRRAVEIACQLDRGCGLPVRMQTTALPR